MLSLFLAMALPTEAGAIGETQQAPLVDNVGQGEKLYKHVFVQLKKLRKALRKADLLQNVRFTLLEQQIKDFNTKGAIEILKEYQQIQGAKSVNKLARKIRRKIAGFAKKEEREPPVLMGMDWNPAAAGVVGTDLVLDRVDGVLEGDSVSYILVRGNCRFGTGSEEAMRTLIFFDVGFLCGQSDSGEKWSCLLELGREVHCWWDWELFRISAGLRQLPVWWGSIYL